MGESIAEPKCNLEQGRMNDVQLQCELSFWSVSEVEKQMDCRTFLSTDCLTVNELHFTPSRPCARQSRMGVAQLATERAGVSHGYVRLKC